MSALSRISILVLISALAGGSALASSDSERRTTDPAAHLQVFHILIGPGPTAMTAFGHNALRVRNSRTGRDLVFNWGAMKPGQARNLRLLFLRKSEASLHVARWRATFKRYRESGRSLQLQHLDLPPRAASDLLRRLAENARPENKNYSYDIFDDNCSTRVRDMLDEALDGTIRRHAKGPSRVDTQRDHLFRVVPRSSATDLAFMFLALGLNKRVDRPITERYDALFLPFDVGEILREITLVHPDGQERPLVSREVVLYEGYKPVPSRILPWLWAPLLAVAVLLPVLAALFDRPRTRAWASAAIFLWGLVAGAVGVVMSIMVFWALPNTHLMRHLLMFSPLHLALLPLGWKLTLGRLGSGGLKILAGALGLTTTFAGAALVLALLGFTGNGDCEVEVFTLAANVIVLIPLWLVLRSRI